MQTNIILSRLRDMRVARDRPSLSRHVTVAAKPMDTRREAASVTSRACLTRLDRLICTSIKSSCGVARPAVIVRSSVTYAARPAGSFLFDFDTLNPACLQRASKRHPASRRCDRCVKTIFKTHLNACIEEAFKRMYASCCCDRCASTIFFLLLLYIYSFIQTHACTITWIPQLASLAASKNRSHTSVLHICTSCSQNKLSTHVQVKNATVSFLTKLFFFFCFTTRL
jgi:hypothetical protein